MGEGTTLKLRWVTCPDCGRKLLRTDGKYVYTKCRGSYQLPGCRAIVRIDPATGETSLKAPEKEVQDGK